MIRAGRSGCPGMSCASTASWRSQGGTPVPYPPCQSSATRPHRGRRRRRRALRLARRRRPEGARVTLISARPLAETASYWAQGGLAAALAVEDSPGAAPPGHARRPGRGLVRRSAAEVLCDEAPDALRRPGRARRALRRRPARRPRARPGGRPQPCAASCTPAAARPAAGSCASSRPTSSRSRASRCSRAAACGALLAAGGRVTGVALDDGRSSPARAVVLASGGAAALWSRTTNPPGSFGSGLLLARAAGAELADLEFVQFHPTAVVGITGREGFLITEAIRGEGATLHDPAASASSTSSRRATRSPARSTGCCARPARRRSCLDMTRVDPARFPNVVAALREAGLDPTTRADPGRRPRATT